MRTSILLLCFLVSLELNAQITVTGVVKDSQNNPLADVEVLASTNLFTHTNQSGEYSIELPAGVEKLEFRKLRYRIQTIAISVNTINVTLINLSEIDIFELSLNELLQVPIVTASKNSETVLKVPASVVVIQKDDIRKNGYKSVEEILQDITGMYMIDDYGWSGTKNFGVRGFFSTGNFSDMIVLVNGVDQRTDVQFSSYMTEKISIPVEAIDRIEVVRGPMSVVYGSGAFFGAINIITNDANTKTENQVSVSAGNFDSRKVFFQFEGNYEKLNYSLHSSFYKDDGIDVPFSDLMHDASIATLPVDEGGWNLSTNHTKHLLRTDRKNVNISANLKNLEFNAGLVTSEKGTVESVFGAGKNGNSLHFLSAYSSLKYKINVSEMFNMSAKLDMTSENHWVDDDIFFAYAATNNISRATSYDLELQAQINPTAKMNIVSGFNTRYVDDFFILVDYPQFGYNDFEWFSEDVKSFGFYTQATYSLSHKFDILAGFRLDNLQPYTLTTVTPDANRFIAPTVTKYTFTSQTTLNFIPRLAFIYSISNNHVVKLLYGKAIKQPSITTQFDMVGTDRTLVPAEIVTNEINYLGILNQSVSLNLSVFYNKLDNLISRTNIITDEGEVIIQSANAGKSQTKGAELSVKLKFTQKINFDISMTYQESKDKRTGFENIAYAYSPKMLGYAKASFVQKKIQFSVLGRYVGAMLPSWSPSNIDETNQPIIHHDAPFDGRIADEVAAHFMLNANVLASKLFKTGLYVNASVSNILDQKIYYPATLGNPQFDKGTLGFGRWAYVSVGYEF